MTWRPVCVDEDMVWVAEDLKPGSGHEAGTDQVIMHIDLLVHLLACFRRWEETGEPRSKLTWTWGGHTQRQ